MSLLLLLLLVVVVVGMFAKFVYFDQIRTFIILDSVFSFCVAVVVVVAVTGSRPGITTTKVQCSVEQNEKTPKIHASVR